MTASSPPASGLPAGTARRRPAPAVLAAAILLLAVHFALAVAGKRTASTTSDELVHLTAGLSYWQNHDYRLHPENGNLPQRWATLPLYLAGAELPPLAGNDYWRTSDVWVFGHQFFYETGADHFPRLMAGRAMIALFSVGIGILVFWWSRRHFGDAGGLVSLALFAFSPDFLAHGALVTSDVCMVFFFFAAIAAWWHHLHSGSARSWWLCAGVLGLAFVAKYSAVLLIPMLVAMAAVRALAPEPWRFAGRVFATPGRRFAAAALSAAAQALVVAAVIWASYGFRYSAFNPELPPADHFIRPWADYVGRTGLIGEFTRGLAALRLLPEAFLYGFDYVLATTGQRSAFLNGELSVTGWRTFFVWTFLLKTTLPVLGLAGLLAAHLARRVAAGRTGWRRLYPWTPLLVLLAVYGASSLASQLNIGHRHILPLYPVLFIAAGRLGRVFVFPLRWPAAAAAALLVWHAAAAVRIAPQHLAYFNPIAGGPANGWRHLVDSSLDWGQDLPALRRWLEANRNDRPAYLAYFGTGQPNYYNLPVRRLAFVDNFRFEHRYVALEPGLYALSATVVQQVYTAVLGPWNPDREKEYQELRAYEPLFSAYTADPARRAELERDVAPGKWRDAIKRHETLRLARLAAYLRVRGPDDFAGYSILIFRLDAAELRAATAGSWSEWANLIERTAAARR